MVKADKGDNSKEIWRVLRIEPENHDTNSLYLEGDDERLRKRRAGQWASIRLLREDGWSEAHPFTISCAPEDEILRFTIKKAGVFTSLILELKPGTPVRVEGTFGVFCRDIEKRQEIAMIAGGRRHNPISKRVALFQQYPCEKPGDAFLDQQDNRGRVCHR